MDTLIWNKDYYSVGIEEVDKQHEKLIEVLNSLHAAMKSGQSKIVLGGILNELIDYTHYHFDTEEKLFDKYGYEEVDLHIIEHNDFIRKIEEFNNNFMSGNGSISISLFRFLNTWLDEHIRVSDKNYSMNFENKGITLEKIFS